ncbi:hypothetical protein [Actinophytocola sp.]|uniref:hypothetical protein n=1 Tax=Actinophytocola sp. TaxID=1872138 RepID=UPI002D5051D7|nr:hypothetical protein [Actinophytocola sp.]HYQ70245.1 hypothetical protein [Actinophytocola sp.]
MARRNGRSDDSDQPTCRSRRHEPGETCPVLPGLHVCAACRDVAEETLVELPALFDLGAYAAPPPDWVNETWPYGAILCEPAISVRAEVLAVLASWCGRVMGERRVGGPAESDIRRFVGFLGIHLHWLCRHPAAPDLVDDLAYLSASVSAAMRPDTGFRAAVGSCPHPACERPVHAEAYLEGAEPYEVACEAGHVWAPERWHAMGGGDRAGGNGVRGHTNGNGHSISRLKDSRPHQQSAD